MAGLFRKKEIKYTLTDKVWMTEAGKFRALISEKVKDPSLVIICWFPATLEKLSLIAEQPDSFAWLASSMHAAVIAGKKIIFAEHFPLPAREKEFMERYQLTKAETWTSLDEPLMLLFGGEKIAGMMKNLGMDENSPLEHTMITKSIHNAQDKISKKATTELSADSAAEWLKNNLPS